METKLYQKDSEPIKKKRRPKKLPVFVSEEDLVKIQNEQEK